MSQLTRLSMCGVSVAMIACGGGQGAPRQLTDQEAYQELFWEYCLPFAEILTELGEGGR